MAALESIFSLVNLYLHVVHQVKQFSEKQVGARLLAPRHRLPLPGGLEVVPVLAGLVRLQGVHARRGGGAAGRVVRRQAGHAGHAG